MVVDRGGHGSFDVFVAGYVGVNVDGGVAEFIGDGAPGVVLDVGSDDPGAFGNEPLCSSLRLRSRSPRR